MTFVAAVIGYKNHHQIDKIFPHLREVGKQAEKEMFLLNKGVNTHKGTIFLGLLVCAAASIVYKNTKELSPVSICDQTSIISKKYLEKDLEYEGKNLTTGLKAYKEYGFTGIRGQVIDGLAIIHNFSLPILKESLINGLSLRLSLVQTLISLISRLDDTTILNRKFEVDRIHFAKKWALKVLEAGGIYTKEGKKLIKVMNEEFKQCSISPGGSADLLIITASLYFWNEELPEVQEILNEIS